MAVYSVAGRALTGGSGLGGGIVLVPTGGTAIGLMGGGTGNGAGGTVMSGEFGATGSGTLAPTGASFKPTGTGMVLRVVPSPCFCEVGCGIPEPGITGTGAELAVGITGSGPPPVNAAGWTEFFAGSAWGGVSEATAASGGGTLLGAAAAGGMLGAGAVFPLANEVGAFRPFGFGPDLLAKLDPVEQPAAETAATTQPVTVREMKLRMANPHP